MEFSVLDKQTIQCVMTEAEIADYGMDRYAICQNDARAEDFFRQVMRRAQRETGFSKRGGDIAVHASFLSDESLEITFFIGTEGAQPQQTEQVVADMETAVFKSRNLTHMIDFCRRAPAGKKASFYVYRGVYFLLIDVSDDGVHDTAALFNLADEYMEEICYTKSIAAFIREHGRCLIEGNALAILADV